MVSAESFSQGMNFVVQVMTVKDLRKKYMCKPDVAIQILTHNLMNIKQRLNHFAKFNHFNTEMF